MKSKFLLCSLLSVFFSEAFSQDNQVFAITGQAAKNFNWTDIRLIDMESGNMKTALFENGKSKFSFLDAETKRPVDLSRFNLPTAPGIQGNALAANATPSQDFSPTMLMSAAAAYDKRHGKFFFSSMKTGQLMWMDTHHKGVASFYTVDQPLIKNDNYSDESLNITRMTIGADGNGYALTNDGNHLIRFTTGKKVVISDLGNLVDAESNNGISIHNQCSSWGGDMVSDAFGSLYLFTANRNVFVIDTKTKVAVFKGTIQNLSPTYTLNGAAVADDDHVFISSANTFEGFYKINVNDLSSVKIMPQGQVFNASDLASSNLLNERKKQHSVGVSSIVTSDVIGNKFISVYPNPVTQGQFKITFDKNPSGRYKIALTDLQGRLVASKDVYVNSRGQVETFHLHRKQSAGMYMIKVSDEANNAVFTDKLVVE